MIKLILVFSIAMQCISCSNSSANEERSRHNNETTTTSNTENTYTESQLNSLLKCGEYAYINGYFAIPDGGCIYFPERNSIGNVEIYAIPKTRTIDIENIDTETNLINSLSANELKETHTIYMIIVDKKYLSHTPNLETPYHPEIPYKQNIYENSGKTWKAVRSISINNENDTQLTAWIAS